MTAALIILLLLLGLLALVWWSQERVLFQPPKSFGVSPHTHRVDYEASDGQRLSGYLIGDPSAAPGTLLCFHGNADLAMWQLDWARLVESHSGHAVMLAEYRGYMALQGRPTYATVKLDAIAAHEYVRTNFGVAQEKMAYFGHSLGSAVATELADVCAPRALLLQSPFSSAPAMAQLILTPALAMFWRSVARIHFDTIAVVRRLDVPVSVAHGKRDRIVPFRMGIEVHNAAKVKGPLLVVEKAGHNDIPELAGDQYWEWICASLDTRHANKSVTE